MIVPNIFETKDWINRPDSGFAKRFPYWGNNKSANLTVNYLKNIGDNHKFNFLVGTEAQEYGDHFGREIQEHDGQAADSHKSARTGEIKDECDDQEEW